ncbi:uncharacterized protein LOC123869105 [Maniola jurtina]|uniref:uncharacterized protein LOC123869105 n=1 Tax=Maniola jurtina TaxID=191418 RepID=UPI001E686B41|nr:uncharacterized protein LOC123869105 [Maniola jurtina]
MAIMPRCVSAGRPVSIRNITLRGKLISIIEKQQLSQLKNKKDTGKELKETLKSMKSLKESDGSVIMRSKTLHLLQCHPAAYEEHSREHEKVIVEEHRRNKDDRKRWRSWTRKYYFRVNEKCIKCKLCNRLLRISCGSTGNIHRHIRLKHPFVYFTENKPKASTENDDSSDEETDKAIEHELIKKSHKIASKENNQVKDGAAVESNFHNSLNRKPDVDKTGQSVTLFMNTRKQRDTSYKRKYYSWTRKYYRKSDKSIKCVLCRGIFSNVNNGNIHRHIKNKHHDVYLSETCSKATTKEVGSDETNLKVTENAVKEIFYIKEVDKIVTKDNAQDDEALESNIDESLADIYDVNETEQSLALAEKVANRNIDRKNWSWTRKYYRKINHKLIMCRICHKILNMNIHRHIRNKHPDIYLKENPIPQESIVDEELRIKNLCENSAVGTRMTKSCFWNFFEMVEQDRVYKCMFCQKSVAVYPKSVGNLKRHIANVHKKQFDLIMKYEGLETEKMISSAACGSEDPGASSVEIAFLSLDDDDTTKLKCSRCDVVLECTEEKWDSVLIQHVLECQTKPEPVQTESDAEILKNMEE